MSTYNITLDQLLTFSAEPTLENAYNRKAYAFNFATVLIVIALVSAFFLNVASALVYGAIGLGMRWIIERNLRETQEAGLDADTKGQRVFKNLNLVEDPNWSPDWLVFCGHTILRHGLPSVRTRIG